MSLLVLTGGARSGKSRLAVEIASGLGCPVTFLATAEALDDELAERIASHRAERPGGWETVEEPLELTASLRRIDDRRALVIDCLSLWASNRLLRGDEATDIVEDAREAAKRAARRRGPTIAVTNEVGLGVVPATHLGRAYRDLLGSVNRIWVDLSRRAALVVAGRVVPLGATEITFEEADWLIR